MKTKIILVSIAAAILYAGGLLTGWWLHKPMADNAAHWQDLKPIFVSVNQPGPVVDVKTKWLTRIIKGESVVKTVTVERLIEKDSDCKKCFEKFKPVCPAQQITKQRVVFNRFAVEAGAGLMNVITDAPTFGYRAAVEYDPIGVNLGNKGRVSLTTRADVQVIGNRADNAALTVGVRVDF